MRPPPKTIMVIEDDPECREAVRDILEYDGYKVVTAENGLVALRCLETGAPPALILLDLMLPVMNGWQFLNEQRSRPALASIPLVLLSAERDLPKQANALAVNGHISKPTDIETLLSIVRRLAGAPA